MLLTRRSVVYALFTLPFLHLHAQDRESSLTDAEVEKLRDTANIPVERIFAFMGFLDERTKGIDKLSAGKRRPGREQDLHDLMEQFTSISNDLDDNLDDYSRRHKDIRRVLPKLISATERWTSSLKTPPEHTDYSVSRKLALEAAGEVRDVATKMIDEQKAYFLAHPPGKDDGGDGAGDSRRRPG